MPVQLAISCRKATGGMSHPILPSPLSSLAVTDGDAPVQETCGFAGPSNDTYFLLIDPSYLTSRDQKLASFELEPWLEANSSGKRDCVVGFCEMAHPIYTCLRNQKTRHLDDAISQFALRINECKIVYEIDAINCLLGVELSLDTKRVCKCRTP